MTRPFDIEILARTVWGEARGEPLSGRIAVAHVVLNRSIDRRWPDTIAEVCLQDKQLSCWNHGDPNRRLILQARGDTPLYLQCMAVAWQVVTGLSPDPTGGANHYFASAVVTPGWHDERKITARIGRHIFLRL